MLYVYTSNYNYSHGDITACCIKIDYSNLYYGVHFHLSCHIYVDYVKATHDGNISYLFQK